MQSLSIEDLMTQEQGLKEHIRAVLAGRTRRIIPKENLRESAVLIPICFSRSGPGIVVTERSMNVEHHKGEISFPGGRSEPEDDGLVYTALREAYEEIGLMPDDVDVLGLLDDHISIMGFHITPVVGTIPFPYNLKINAESKTLLHVPLKHALKDTVWMAEKTTFMGRDINIYFLEIDGGVVWGATARMLKHFIDLVAGRTVAFTKVSAHVRSWVEEVVSKQATYQVNNIE